MSSPTTGAGPIRLDPNTLYTVENLASMGITRKNIETLRTHGLSSVFRKFYLGAALLAALGRCARVGVERGPDYASGEEQSDEFFDNTESDHSNREVPNHPKGSDPVQRRRRRAPVHSLAETAGQVGGAEAELKQLREEALV